MKKFIVAAVAGVAIVLAGGVNASACDPGWTRYPQGDGRAICVANYYRPPWWVRLYNYYRMY